MCRLSRTALRRHSAPHQTWRTRDLVGRDISQGALGGHVHSLVEELCGTSLDGVEAGTSFLEIGLDSLLLTQAATLLQRKFGVAVSFRQLMEDLSTIDSLAAPRRTPPRECVRSARNSRDPGDRPCSCANSGVPRLSGGLEQLLQQQLQMTAQLLAAVRDQSGAMPRPSAPPLRCLPAPSLAPPVRRIQKPRAIPSNGSRQCDRTNRAATAHARCVDRPLHQTHDWLQATGRTEPVGPCRSSQRSRLQAAMERDRLSHLYSAVRWIEGLGRRRQRVH